MINRDGSTENVSGGEAEASRINRNDPENRQKEIWARVANPDLLPESTRVPEEYPSPEIALLRMAIDKALMNEQKEVWYMYAYDKATFVEIGKKFHITGSSAQKRVKTIEKQLKKWCEKHMEIYEALKLASEHQEGLEHGDEATGC